MSTNFESVYSRIDYNQIGLTSVDTLKAIDFNSNVLVCVGDHTGSVDCFLIKSSDLSAPETLFKTLPNANSKINCVEIIAADTRSPRFLISFGSSVIRGFNKKGKQFFGLELNNLTEPIKHLKVRWPSEVMVAGQFIYNHYVISSDDANSKSSSVQNRNCYISSGKINCLQVLDEKINHKSVTILACEDRLIRVILDSTCEFEVETLGICNVITRIPDYNQFLLKGKQTKSSTKLFYFAYGTSNGRLSLLKLNFGQSPIEATHCWEINLEQSKSAVQCITPTISLANCCKQEADSGGFSSYEASEFCVGRADGSIELFSFENYINEDANEIVNLEQKPKLLYEYNCKERLTSIAICKSGQLIICCTFTGCVFSFTREQGYARSLAPVPERRESIDESIEKDTAMRIEELGLECVLLEERLNKERENYLKWTSGDGKRGLFKDDNQTPLSALPYLAINDSFVLQDNASHLLTIECEAQIDCILFQSEIEFDLVDCERNSAVISFNDNQHSSFFNSKLRSSSFQASNNAYLPNHSSQILATFRCQANTTRLEIKISSIEGQFGQFRAYVLTKVAPKSCQVRNYTIKALSLHKRKCLEPRNGDEMNRFVISGQFSLSEAYSWLYFTLPEIPEKLSNPANENRVEFTFQSTLVNTRLQIELTEGRMHFESDSVSTISILKDFLTREATRRSIQIELKLDLNRSTVSAVLTTIYSKLKVLIRHRSNAKLKEAIQEIETVDKEIALKMAKELEESKDKLAELGLRGDQNELDRFYGLITDLFIDYEKVNGNNTNNMINIFKPKIDEMVSLIESYTGDEYNVDIFIQKICEFWRF